MNIIQPSARTLYCLAFKKIGINCKGSSSSVCGGAILHRRDGGIFTRNRGCHGCASDLILEASRSRVLTTSRMRFVLLDSDQVMALEKHRRERSQKITLYDGINNSKVSLGAAIT